MPRSVSPLVSIILPVYNGQDWLDQALQSLVGQTFADFELLVIDDGSTDQSAARIRRWAQKDSRIRLMHNDAPHGLPYALNRGLREAKGAYIARADHDDIHRPNRLALQVTYLNTHPQIMLLGGGYQPFSSAGQRPPIIHPSEAPMIAWKMLTGSAFCHPSVMFRRTIVDAIGDYPVTASEDFAFFSRVVRQWPTANLPDVLLDYREHDANYSVTRRAAMAASVRETYRENIRFYLDTTDDADMIYGFLVRRRLPLTRLAAVFRDAFRIAAKIQRTYRRPPTDPAMRKLRCHIWKELLAVAVRTLLGRPPIGADAGVKNGNKQEAV